MGDRVGVPALGEHRHRHDAADVLAELARLADRVHRLAQEVAVGEFVGIGTGVAREVRPLEGGDLERGVLLELAGERVAGLDLRGVDEQRPLAGGPRPTDDVAEERQVARHELPRPVGLLELTARDPVEHELGDRGVRAHDDQHGRRLAEMSELLLVGVVAVLVAAIEAAYRAFENPRHRPARCSEVNVLADLLGQRRIDLVPQLSVCEALLRSIVVDGDSRHLHDPGLDGVHQREVAHDPREDEALEVTGPLQVIRRGVAERS
jgi:hypothetical protein